MRQDGNAAPICLRGAVRLPRLKCAPRDGRGIARDLVDERSDRVQDGLELDQGLGRSDRHRVEVVVELGLGQQLLQAAVSVQAAAAVAQLAGQELEVGGQDIDSPDSLADVRGRRVIDRRAQVLEERVDLGEAGIEPGRGRREPLDARS